MTIHSKGTINLGVIINNIIYKYIQVYMIIYNNYQIDEIVSSLKMDDLTSDTQTSHSSSGTKRQNQQQRFQIISEDLFQRVI